MPTEDPKKLLSLAEKQIATAKDALAIPDQIRRLKSQIEKEKAALLDSADPEDRAQMKQLGDLNAQLEVIPHRITKAAEKQTAAGVALAETGGKLARVIAELAAAEQTKYLDEIEAKLLPYDPDRADHITNIKGHARALAGSCAIIGHIAHRAAIEDGARLRVVEDTSDLHNTPASALPNVIDFVQARLVILSQWFADNKTFVAREFWKSA